MWLGVNGEEQVPRRTSNEYLLQVGDSGDMAGRQDHDSRPTACQSVSSGSGG